MIGALLAVALAQSEATLVEGDTLLAVCLDTPACGVDVVGLLSDNMAEYGFTQQVDPIAVSALGGKGMGLVAELRLDTVTLGPRNELEQRVLIPPALPRLALGYHIGNYTYDDPFPQVSVGLSVLPPFRVLGGTLATANLDLSAAVPLGTHVVWGGAEVGYGYGHVAIPLLGTEEQLRQLEQVAPYLPSTGAQCSTIQKGCLDSFGQHTVSGRLGLSFEPVPALFAYTRVAAVALTQRLELAYDTSVWASRGVQPQLHIGAGARAGDKYQLALGGVVAGRPPELSVFDKRTMTKVVFSTSFRFGDARYWLRDDPS